MQMWGAAHACSDNVNRFLALAVPNATVLTHGARTTRSPMVLVIVATRDQEQGDGCEETGSGHDGR